MNSSDISDNKSLLYSIIYFNRHKHTMAEFHQMLDQALQGQQKPTVYPIAIFMPDTFIRHKFQAHLCQKAVIFVHLQTKKIFTINTTCKMVPKYEQKNVNEETLCKITVHKGTNEMVIECEDKDKLTQIYTKLKLLLSHKGFNEFFKPIKRLGKGAFATVYLIQHKITKQRWAAKVFSRQGQKLEFKGQEALQNEIRTLRFLSHPNIIKYEGVYQTDNLIYLVTQYLSGGTLDQFTRNKNNLRGDATLNIINQTLQALKYLEANNIMHRDLKPQNILLRQSDSKWVLADFGLSAFIKENHIYDKCGTMGYMAPEILSENLQERQLFKAYSSACDLYSLGIIAYNLIIGCLPFKVQAEGMFDRRIVWDAWKKTQCEEVHIQVINFLKGLLQSNPSKRWNCQKALFSSFLKDEQVIQSWKSFNDKKIDERFQKILKMANIN